MYWQTEYRDAFVTQLLTRKRFVTASSSTMKRKNWTVEWYVSCVIHSCITDAPPLHAHSLKVAPFGPTGTEGIDRISLPS